MPDFERKKHLRLLGLWDTPGGGGTVAEGLEFAFRLTDSTEPTGAPMAFLVVTDGDYVVEWIDTTFYTQSVVTAEQALAADDDIQTVSGTGGVVSNAFNGHTFSLVQGDYIILYSQTEVSCSVLINDTTMVIDNG